MASSDGSAKESGRLGPLQGMFHVKHPLQNLTDIGLVRSALYEVALRFLRATLAASRAHRLASDAYASKAHRDRRN
jgi:hypothetical protein